MENIICEECNAHQASLNCPDCDQLFCVDCDMLIHRNGKRKLHVRSSVITSVSDSDFPALPSMQASSFPSSFPHQYTVGIFWDLFSVKLNSKILQETAFLLKSRFGQNLKIRVYGDQHFYLFTQLQSADYELCVNRDGSETVQILKDIQSFNLKSAKNLLISSRAHLFKSQLLSLGIANLKVMKSPSDVSEIDLEKIESNPWSFRNPSENVYGFTRRKAASENSLELTLITFLKNLAYEGKVLHFFSELKEKVAFHLKIPIPHACDLINTACKLGKLLHQSKKIGNFEVPIISLKVEKMTTKVLLWVLRSLKHDEMISTEKAIQSRIKEAFDLKFSPQSWSQFLDAALKPCHKKSLSQIPSFSLFSSQDHNRKNLNFSMKKLEETGPESLVIYPVNEEWVSYDQYIKSGDLFQIKKTYEWKAFVNYFTNLYSAGYSEDQAVCGGRYGCAQYLKNYAEALGSSSLGKLSYMVQLAIDEDLLRYHKTLLVWAPAFDKKCKEDKKALMKAKKIVVDAVAAQNEGVALAQLPGLLKERMLTESELSNLGFAKLKDLVLQIPDVELMLKGKNHPFVKVKKMKTVTNEGILNVINKKVTENGGKVLMIDAEIAVAEEFGYGVRWGWVKVRSFEEFVRNCGEFVVCDKKFVERVGFGEKSLGTTSENSDGHSHHAALDLVEDDEGDSGVFQLKFIEDLLEDEEDYSEKSVRIL